MRGRTGLALALCGSALLVAPSAFAEPNRSCGSTNNQHYDFHVSTFGADAPSCATARKAARALVKSPIRPTSNAQWRCEVTGRTIKYLTCVSRTRGASNFVADHFTHRD